MNRARTIAVAWLLASTPVCAAPSRAVLDAESQRIAVMDRVKDCVLAVFPLDGQGGGSGVVVSPDGYALSNFHVVAPCGKAMQCGMADGRVYDAVLVGLDPTGDVALIKLFGRDDFPAAALGDSDRVRPGDWVFAMGNPFLLAADMQPTVTYGIISGVHRYQFPAGTLLEYADCLQTDASINPGNSGGPLFDMQGRLIGVNGRASFEKRGRVNVGAAYAVSINQIKNFLAALKAGRIVDHAALGARATADAEGRVVVAEILESSDAFRRGLRYDDEIVSFAGRPIRSPNELNGALGVLPAGWRVPLSFRRDGIRRDVLVRLAGVHGEEELIAAVSAPTLPEEPKRPSKEPPPREIPMPETVKKHFQEKRGYANYYFNRLEQRRVWSAWMRTVDAQGPWTFLGRTAQGAEFRLEATDAGAAIALPTVEYRWEADGPWTAPLPPAHSGGLLPALYLWRRLAVEGLERFGEIHYEGAAPLPGRNGWTEVLAGSHRSADVRFYFDPDDGRLLAMELFSSDDSDPCELYFEDYRRESGVGRPGRIKVRCGDQAFAVFEIAEAGK